MMLFEERNNEKIFQYFIHFSWQGDGISGTMKEAGRVIAEDAAEAEEKVREFFTDIDYDEEIEITIIALEIHEVKGKGRIIYG